MSFRGYMLLAVGLVFGGALLAQAQKDREQKKPVDIKAEMANRYPDMEDNAIVLTGDVVFHHNGAVISCDSAVRYSDRRIDCFKNVIINKDSTYIYGDKAEYNGDLNTARVYSPVVKVIDGDATLYTYNFTFNTLDNIGIYYGGGVMYQQDNVMESERGYYYSDVREMVAVRNVEIKNDDYQMSGDSVRYNMQTKVASFFTKSYIWTTEGEILTADKGRYNTQDSTYFFYRNAYVLTEFRETWADTIDYRGKREDALLYGNIQINDEENTSSAFGDFGQYWGERGETMLTKRPSIFNYSEEHNNNDTLYMRADTIFMFVIYPSDRKKAGEADPHAHLRWVDSLPDSVRLGMADSLKTVIAGLRTESDKLRRRADSIMNALYPPETPVRAVSSEPEILSEEPDVMEEETGAVFDSLPPVDTLGIQEFLPALDGVEESAVTEAEVEQPSRRRRDRNRGPNPDSWFYPDTLTSVQADSIPLVQTPDSLAVAVVPPTSTDSLSAMEKVMELLPGDLSGKDASSLLEMLDGEVPEELSHLVSDSIDVAALRNVIETAAKTEIPSKPVPVVEPEPEPEPEKYIPPEVVAMRKRLDELKAEIDSLQTAETYIRPKPKPVDDRAGQAMRDSLALQDSLALRDSLWRMDSLAVADSLAHLDAKTLKRFEKAEAKRLKAEQKAAKRAEKLRIREEKRAAKVAKRAEKEAERRRKLIARGKLALDSLGLDSLPRLDSLALLDSLERLRLDSLESIRPEEPESQPDTTERIIRGWYDVRIWRQDMQAVCDSIVNFSRDSTIHMYTDPILWQGESQIVCDSLTLFTDGENIDRGEFYGSPIMSSKLATGQFNQVTGRTMTSWFRDNEVYRHDIFGNAEAYYYIQEDDDPVPVAFIVATSSNMTFLIEDQFVRYIVARENVEWPVYPIEQIPPTQPIELKGFRWLEDRKPELKDVFDRRIRATEREFHEGLEQPKFPIAAKINRRREYLINNRLWADRVDPLPAHAVEYVNSLGN